MVLLVGGSAAMNVLAYRHAAAMLTYRHGVERTASPEALSWTQKLQVLAGGVSLPHPRNSQSPTDYGLEFETLRFPSTGAIELEAWLIPARDARGSVALFHGYSASRASLLNEAKIFNELGYDAMLVDFRGCGGSTGDVTTLGYCEAEDVAAAVRVLQARGLSKPLVLYGQSMGGAAILRAVAQLNARPHAIIVESVFARMLDAVKNRFRLMELPTTPGSQLLLFWGGVGAGFDAFSHNPADYARVCACPSLVMHGAADQHARPEEGRAVFDNLAGRKEFVLFPNAGHNSLASASPEAWKASVAKLLNEVQRR